MAAHLRVFMVTCEWPSVKLPNSGCFVVQQVEFLRRAGIHVEVFHFRGAMKSSNYYKAWRQVREQLSKQSYDVFHAQWGQSALLAFPRKLPLVVTLRGSDVNGIPREDGRGTFKGWILSSISKWMARMADEAILVSQPLTGKLPKRPYHIIPSGIDLTLFQPMSQQEARAHLNLPMNKSLVLFAADTENPLKRFDLAKTAVARLNGQFEAELVVAKNIPRSQMSYYLNACDLLLLTSVHEGSPNVVKEALACNVPVVSVDVGDVRQRIGSVKGCVVCSDDRPETIATGLARVLATKQRINGRSVIRELDEKILTQKIVSVYEQAIAHG